jgi:hypothetical protein
MPLQQMRRCALLLPSLACLAFPLAAAGTPPQEVIDTLCRSHLFAGAAKLGRDTVKQLGKCHSQRLNGQLPAPTDCNQETNAPWADLRARDAESLRVRARKRCTVPPASSPASLGFTSCPAPCDALVPSIGTYGDVAECLICRTYRISETLSATVFGTPTLPAGEEEPCWARLTRGVRHYYGLVMKVQRACQLAQDKDQLPPEIDCRTYDPRGRIARAAELVGKAVSYCSDTDLVALDSCAETVGDEHACLLDEMNAAAAAMFEAVY